MKYRYFMLVFFVQVAFSDFVSAQNSSIDAVLNEMQDREKEIVSVDSALLLPNTQVKRIRIRNYPT